MCQTRISSRRGTRLVMVGLLLAVVGPRVLAGAAIGSDFWSRGDLNWDAMARNLLSGHGLLIPHVGPMGTPMYAHKGPIFALVLAAVYEILGRWAVAVIAVQICFALLATWMTFHLGLRLCRSRRAGWIAAFLSAVYPPLVVQDIQIMETALFRTLVLGLTLALLQAAERPRIRTILGLGLTAALALLTRTTILFFLPVAGLWLLLQWRRRGFPLLRPALLSAGLFLIVLSPWLVRNALLFGRLHLITGGGRSFWIARGEPFLALFPSKSVDVAERHEWRALPFPERRRLAHLDEIALDRALFRIAWRDLRDHPTRIPKLVFLKTAAAFSWFLNPSPGDDAADRRYGRVKRWVYTASYGPLLFLGAAGLLLLLLRRPAGGSLLLLHYLSFEVFSVLFWAHSRHRYYLDTFLVIASVFLLGRMIAFTRPGAGSRRGDAGAAGPGIRPS